MHVGDLLGLLVSFPLQGAIGAGAIEPSGVAAVLIVALVAAVMLALDDETRFLSWEMAQSYVGEVCVASTSAAGTDRATGAGAVAGAGAATGAGVAVGAGAVAGACAAGEAESGHLVLRPQSVRNAGREGEGAAGETGVSAPAAAGASPSASSSPSQNPQPVDFIGQRVALLAREHKLTPRETEVFGLLAHGRSIPYVRDALIISRDTAATHAKHIYAKLDVHSRQELIDLVMSDEL